VLMHDGPNEDPILLPFVKNREREAGDQPPANACPLD